jgi:amino acid adenylation domain-containing protein
MNRVDKVVPELPPEQKAIRAKCFHPTGVFTEFRKEDVEQSIPARFERIVATYPDRTALKSKNRLLTYAMLNKAANRLARTILSKRADGERPVAVLFKHDVAMLVGILGTFKTGKLCVPLDPGFQEARTRSIAQDCGAKLVITDGENLSLAYELAQDASQVINLDEVDERVPSENLGLCISPNAFSYILYTSGSTGEPKGVVQSHRNILYDVKEYTNSFHICADDRLTLFASCSGGEGMKNALNGLLNGATVCQWNVKSEGFAGIAPWLISEEITIWISTPTLFRNFVATLRGEERFTTLRLIRLGSGAVHKIDVKLYKDHLPPECILVNWLSSTEVGAIAGYFIDKKTELSGDTVPVGYAVEGKELLLLDNARKQVGFDDIGEFAVKSRYLSAGYWQTPELTSVKFLPDPDGGDRRTYLSGDMGCMHPDGCLEYLGRKDSQLKVRGYRFEAIEVERALLDLNTVKQAVVMAREDQDRPGEQRLIAYVVSYIQPTPSVSEMRAFLKDKLPEYMVPSAFVFLDVLLLAPNGKVDKRALPDPAKSRPNLDIVFVAPRTAVEKTLAKIWAAGLSLDEVGIHDHFFDLGGESLSGTKILNRVRELLDVDLPLSGLFDTPTIAEMAETIAEMQAKNPARS